ncbi:MAG: histidinol-phosphate transaminase [Candidatus Methanomethylicia archaeon]
MNWEVIKLDANENFFIPRIFLSNLVKEIVDEVDLRLYPSDKVYMLLIHEISSLLNVPVESIVIGNGSDDLIALLVKILAKRGIIITNPTFRIYRWAAEVFNVRIYESMLTTNFDINVDDILRLNNTADLCFICSPNNPTGNQFRIDDLEKLINKFNGIVVVDEAYVDFADYSTINILSKYDNLIIVRTFSKGFGLASFRLGFLVASYKLADKLRSSIPPFNVNTISVLMGIKMIKNRSIVEEAIRKLKIERERLINALSTINGIKPFGSKTNFILFRTETNVESIYNYLYRNKVFVRRFDDPPLNKHYLRVTVGTPDMNDVFINVLKEAVSQ